MESPHPDWSSVGNGYRLGENRLTVTQRGNGWLVGAVAPDAIAPPSGPLLITETEREAYEITKLLTWVASEQGFETLLDNLRESSPNYSGHDWSLGTRVPEDVDPREAVRRLLGAYKPIFNTALPPA